MGSQSVMDSKGPKLDQVVGVEDFDVNCCVCALDTDEVDSDPREGYVRTTLTFGPNIFIRSDCTAPSTAQLSDVLPFPSAPDLDLALHSSGFFPSSDATASNGPSVDFLASSSATGFGSSKAGLSSSRSLNFIPTSSSYATLLDSEAGPSSGPGLDLFPISVASSSAAAVSGSDFSRVPSGSVSSAAIADSNGATPFAVASSPSLGGQFGEGSLSLEPSSGSLGELAFSSAPSAAASSGPSIVSESELTFPFASVDSDRSIEASGPSMGPATSITFSDSGSSSSNLVCPSAAVYEDSIVGYAVFLVSASHEGRFQQQFYLDDSIAFIPKGAESVASEVDPITNCGCPRDAYSVEVQVALPASGQFGDRFVFMVAPVLADSKVLPVGVSVAVAQDVATTLTTTYSATTTTMTTTTTSPPTSTSSSTSTSTFTSQSSPSSISSTTSSSTSESSSTSSSSTSSSTSLRTTTTTTSTTTSTVSMAFADAFQVRFAVQMTVADEAQFVEDAAVLQALIDTLATYLDIPASQVEASLRLLRRLEDITGESRHLTSTANVEVGYTVLIPEQSSKSQEDVVTGIEQLSGNALLSGFNAALGDAGVDASQYNTQILDISAPTVEVLTSTSSASVGQTTLTSTTSTTASQSGSGSGPSNETSGAGGGIIALIVILSMLALAVPAFLLCFYIKRRREHEGQDPMNFRTECLKMVSETWTFSVARVQRVVAAARGGKAGAGLVDEEAGVTPSDAPGAGAPAQEETWNDIEV